MIAVNTLKCKYQLNIYVMGRNQILQSDMLTYIARWIESPTKESAALLQLDRLKLWQLTLIKILMELSTMIAPLLRVWHESGIPVPKHSVTQQTELMSRPWSLEITYNFKVGETGRSE